MDKFDEAKVKLMMKARGIDRVAAMKILAGMNRADSEEKRVDTGNDDACRIDRQGEYRLMTAKEFFGDD